MNVMRRLMVGVALCALLLASVPARAQALKQLPADALVVVKLNKPGAVSQKFGALATKLGLANFQKDLADPLAAVKRQMNIKEGFDDNGEIAVAVYDPGQPNAEPLVLALVPVTDFKAFTANLANVKQDGELTTFTMPNDVEVIYAASWGSYAAITPTKELLAKKPAGMTVEGLAARQLAANDVTLYANARLIGSKLLPQFKQMKPNLLQQAEAGMARDLPNQKFTPVLKALVSQALNAVEETLADGQSATFSINLTEKGINTSLVAEFDPATYLGKTFASFKNTDANLVKGLPDRAYFAFGGMVTDPAVSNKLFDDLVGPVAKELAGVGDEAKVFNDLLASAKASLGASESMTLGYAKPTGQPGKTGLIQAVGVTQGNAKVLAEAQRTYLKASTDMMKMMPQDPNLAVTMDVKPGAKTVDGTTLDTFSMQFKLDPNNPAMAEAAQAMNMIYGPNGMSGFLGALDDRNYLMVMGDEELLNAAVASARKGDEALAGAAHVKAVTAELPQKRAAVYYLAVDNMVNTGIEYAQAFGLMPPNAKVKLPPNLPPIGFSFGTEGPALRFDTHIPTELVESLVSTGIQAFMMMQQGGANRGGL